MAGLPRHELRKLTDTLLESSFFDDEKSLKNIIFNDDRISFLWAKFPETNTSIKRVRASIAFFQRRYNDIGENMLLVLLNVLSDLVSSQDAMRHELTERAKELAPILNRNRTEREPTSGDTEVEAATQKSREAGPFLYCFSIKNSEAHSVTEYFEIIPEAYNSTGLSGNVIVEFYQQF